MSEVPTPGQLAQRSQPEDPEAEATIEASLSKLQQLTDTPVIEHVAVFEEIQKDLADVLHSIDDN